MARVARVRGPAQFKKLVEDRFLSDLSRDERHRRLQRALFGTSTRSAIEPNPPVEIWESGGDNIEAFLVHYARHFLDADIYNALKHGLAVRPGRSMTQLGDGSVLRADGPAIEYLSLRRQQDDRPRWNLSTHWIDVDRSLVMTYLATRLIESIWTMARFRYLGEKPASLNAWAQPAYSDVLKHFGGEGKGGIMLETMHVELDYYSGPHDLPDASPTSGS